MRLSEARQFRLSFKFHSKSKNSCQKLMKQYTSFEQNINHSSIFKLHKKI
ncbi:hypothetical protein LguiB_013292 [Lonicera macranthoides]